MTLQEHVIKGLCEFIKGNSSLYIPTLPKFGSHKHCGSGYIMILVCHVILQDHVVMWSCDFMGRSGLKLSHYPTTFNGLRHVVGEI